jgi:ABC-type transporter Mla subunit MlaD
MFVSSSVFATEAPSVEATKPAKSPVLDVNVNSVNVELTTIGEATKQLAEAMQALSGSLDTLANSDVELSPENQQKLSEMIGSATQLTNSVNTMLETIPNTARELPQVNDSLAGIALSLESINNDVIEMLAQYPDFVSNTEKLFDVSKDHIPSISLNVLDNVMWKLIITLIIVVSIILLLAVGLPVAFIYGIVAKPKKALLDKLEAKQ